MLEMSAHVDLLKPAVPAFLLGFTAMSFLPFPSFLAYYETLLSCPFFNTLVLTADTSISGKYIFERES